MRALLTAGLLLLGARGFAANVAGARVGPQLAGQWSLAIKAHFEAPRPEIGALVPVMAQFYKLDRMDPVNRANLAPVVAQMRLQVERLSALDPKKLEPARLRAIYEKLRLAHALFWADLPPEQQIWISGAEARYAEAAGAAMSADVQKKMDAVIGQVFHAKRMLAAETAVMAGGGAAKTMPAAWKLQPSGAAEIRMQRLNEVAPAELGVVRGQIVAEAQKMYDQSQAENTGGIFPIPPQLFDQIYQIDARSGLSQVMRDKAGAVVGFALAYFDPQSGSVHLEKLGVIKERRQGGLSKQMLHQLAKRAAELGVDSVELLVVKTNSNAIAAYERMGFTNATPTQVWTDPRYNAYLYRAPTAILTTRTRSEEESAPPVSRRSRWLGLLGR